MVGFNNSSNVKSAKRPNKERDFMVDDDYDDDDALLGGIDVPDIDDEDDEDVDYSNPRPKIQRPRKENEGHKKTIIICVSVVVALVVVLGVIFGISSHKKKKAIEEAEQQALLQQQQQQNSKTDEENVSAGVPNLYGNRNDTNTLTPEPTDNITANLNKQPIDSNYKIVEIKTVTDFINYEKHRAITAEGLEFYWLEATYKDRPYKVQVPLAIAKELETKGITVVDVEVAVLEDKSEIVTYMSVRKDAKNLLEENR